jgi:hypothetical protein
LKLQEEDQTKITSKQYLEKAFKEMNGNSAAVEQKNRVRRPLNYFFQERDCVTLVRPTDEEWKLHKLSEIDEKEIRPDFMEGIQKVRQKVI